MATSEKIIVENSRFFNFWAKKACSTSKKFPKHQWLRFDLKLEVLFIKVLVDVWVLFAKGDSPINFIKGTLRLVTAALMVVPTIKNLFAKNHKEKLSMVGDCFFMFSGWWLLHSWILNQIHVGDCSFSGGRLLHLPKIKQHNFGFFFSACNFYFWTFCPCHYWIRKYTSSSF